MFVADVVVVVSNAVVAAILFVESLCKCNETRIQISVLLVDVVACEDAIQVASFDLLQFDTPDVTSRPDLGDDTLQALVGSGTTLTLQVRQHMRAV